eukprot:5168288-Prymnesium_polylepis.2
MHTKSHHRRRLAAQSLNAVFRFQVFIMTASQHRAQRPPSRASAATPAARCCPSRRATATLTAAAAVPRAVNGAPRATPMATAARPSTPATPHQRIPRRCRAAVVRRPSPHAPPAGCSAA